MKNTSATATRFAQLQARWQDADLAARLLRNELDRRYQSHRYAKSGERKKLESLERAGRKHSDRFLGLLASISPRDWTSGVPVVWLRDGLTYADAVTTGALSVVPPPSWGSTVRDSEMFAMPIRSEVCR